MSVLLAAGATNVIITQFLAFGLLAFFLIKFGLPVMRKALAARKREVSDTFERLDRESREAAQRIAEFKERLAGIDAEAKKRMQAALDEGAKAKAQSIAEANVQAAAELEKAKRSIGIERDKAVMELRSEVARLTLEATEKTIDGLMNEKLHGKIVDGYLDTVEKAARGR